MSCAIGMAVLDTIEEDGLMQRATELGERFMVGLRELQERYPIIGDVRGRGLFLGFEMVRDRETQEPATEEAARLVDEMCARNVLLSTDGPHHNVIKIKPPMVITEEDATRTMESLDEALDSIMERIQ